MLKKRDQGAKGEEMEEEHLLALILKENVKEPQCKTQLGNYCKALHTAGLESGKVHDKLKDICKDGKIKDENNKCKELETKIQDKCTELKNGLDGVFSERPVKSSNCTQYEPQCLFLGACSKDVIEKCSELRTECYEIKRGKVVDEIALRALKGSLKEDEECKKKLEEHCPILSRMSHELMEKCLDPKGACKSLITEAEKKCTSLKTEVEKEVKNDGCLPLLEQCHFYQPNCKEERIKTKCDELRKKCDEDYDILYIPPEEPWFPIQPRVSIIEEVGVEGLYKAITQEGVLINKLKLPSMDDLIFFLSQKKGNMDFDQEECKKIDKENCEYLKELSKNSNYECTNIKDECGKLEGKLQQRRDKLKEDIQIIRLFNGKNGIGDAEIISWNKLDSDFNGENCAELESECFYLDKNGKSSLAKACQNIQNMCYKRGVDAIAYETLESRMRGEFRDSGQNWLNQCQGKLINVCEKVKTQSHDLFALCLQPKKTCQLLNWDIQTKVHKLNRILDFKRDFPEEHDCSELESKCDRLKEEDTFLLGPCNTLEKNCRHLKESKQLRNLLLEEKKNLSDITNCTEKVNDKCHHYSRKIDKQFELSCALQNDTCKMINFYINKYCDNLQRNIKGKEIITKLSSAKDKIDQLRELCPTWLPYCDTLLPSCAEELAEENNDTLCLEIQKLCKPYQEREALEDAILYKFQGHLENETKCNSALEEHCVKWTQNDTFSSLCNDTNGSKKSDKVKELCERLVKRVKKLCKTLPSKLEEENKELTERIATYEKLKQEAEEKANTTNIILTFTIKNDTTNKTDTPSHALVKRSEHHPTITEKEAEAFDLVAMVTTEYVELEEKCKKLRLDCGFKKECPDSKVPCNEIDNKCKELKPLKIRPPEVTTSTTTTTTTTTEKVTVDPQGKTICTSGASSINMNCTSIHTTDTWVTHTSTHTSTKTQTSTVTSKVTIISTKKCQPTQCTTDRTHPTHGSGGEEAGEVKPSGGMRIHGWGAKGVVFMILFSMIYF